MKRILIGGSPCTNWSIAQKNNRETEAEGIGWELFKNYLIAKEKFKPDFFLYENNKSAAQAIKDQISIELGVPLQYINSALVSAQNRQRFYAHNIPNVPQPEDRGILLKDILESGEPWTEKSYCLTASYDGAVAWNTIERKQRSMIAEPVCLRYERTDEAKKLRKQYENHEIHHGFNELRTLQPRTDGKSNTVSTVTKDNMVAEPLVPYTEKKIAEIVEKYGYLPEMFNPYNCSEITDKAPTLTAQGNSQTKSSTVMVIKEATKQGYTEIMPGDCVDLEMPNSKTRRGRNMKDKCNCLMTSNQHYQYCGTTDKPIYEVRDGLITIKDKTYPIKLIDGYYIIRKLTVNECCRLQTMPDDYMRAVSVSQGYKGLGNGWTAEAIIHQLRYMNIPLDEEIEVLSMYDGIGTGRYCFDKMGYTNIKYHAYEIDKYAMQVAMSNYPDIIQYGDAFQVRNDGWSL